MTITGKITVLTDIETHGTNFKKKTCVLETDGQYPQTVAIEFTNDRIDLLDSIPIGADVCIAINIRGRAWTNPEGVTKYFTSLNGWKIDVLEEAATITPKTPAEQKQDNIGADESSDLPF